MLSKIIFVFGIFSSIFTQAATPMIDRTELILEIADQIVKNYSFLDVATKLAASLNEDAKSKKYNSLTDKEFTKVMTKRLRDESKDMHFFMKFEPGYQTDAGNVHTEKQKKIDEAINRMENFGFEKAERLKGNVGYINFKGFAEVSSSKEALAAAMKFVSNTNALIVDLRENRGGDGDMVVLFCSYFIEKKTKLHETYYRNTGKTNISWSAETVDGPKYLNRPVYFLTSKTSFSAAEAVPYILQKEMGAKVVGENTGGAANPVDAFLVGKDFLLFVPNGKVTVTKTQSNWNHEGVKPDFKTSAKNALAQAHVLALKDNLKNKTPSELNEKETLDLIKNLE